MRRSRRRMAPAIRLSDDRSRFPAGIPGLSGRTYTLLPSNYALLPGGYRVELGGTAPVGRGGAFAVGNGTYAVSALTSIANTSVKSPLPSMVLITSGTSVRSLSQYNEESYSDFLAANAAQFGNLPSLLPADGKALVLEFAMQDENTLPYFSFDGTALFISADGGRGGTAVINGAVVNGTPLANMEVYAKAAGPTPGFQRRIAVRCGPRRHRRARSCRLVVSNTL